MQMNEKIKEVFEQIHAEEALKDTTKEFLSQKIRQRPKHTFGTYRHLLPAAACFLFVLLGIGGYHAYFTPVSVISIDINPSIEWNINRFDRIVSVANYNEDGEALSATLDVANKSYSEALDILVNSPMVKDYLARNEYLTLTVVEEENSQNEQMLQTVRSCTSGIRNVYCVSADYSQLEEAHESGLSCGKYNAYLVLQSLDPDITPAEIQQMTMREIRDLIDTLSEETTVETDSTGYPGSKGQHHEHGGSGKGPFP